MKTLRHVVCPCCNHSMSLKALSGQPYGQFQVDIRLCQGRKGFPHVGTEALNQAEKGVVRARLLGAIQAALEEGVLTTDDLAPLVGGLKPVDHRQLTLGLGERVRPAEAYPMSGRETRSYNVNMEVRDGKR